MKLLFISCLLIVGTFAGPWWRDRVGTCVKKDDVPYLVLSNQHFYSVSSEQCKTFCAESELCHGVAFQLRSHSTGTCTAFMGPIKDVTTWPFRSTGVTCSKIDRYGPYSGSFADGAGRCRSNTPAAITYKEEKYVDNLGYTKCKQKCIAMAFCKGVEHYSNRCKLYGVQNVIVPGGLFKNRSPNWGCATFKRHPNWKGKWKALNTTHTNKPTNKPTINSANLLDQGASGASSVSLNVSTLLVVVFASLFL